MKNIIIPLIIMYAGLMSGCAGRNSGAGTANSHHVHSETCTHSHGDHDHSHEDHDHSHEDHDHEPHGHSGHSHAGHEHGPECSHDHDHDRGGSEDGEIIFPASQAARVNLQIEEIRPASFRSVIRASGDIVAAQGDAQAVVAPVAGVVSFPQARIAPGMKVGKGDVLFYVSSRNIAGGDAAARAKTAWESAKAEYDRAAALLPDKLVSQREYEDARRAYLDAKNEWEALSAGSTDRGSAVRAPAGGYVSAVAVSEGEFAEVGQQLAVVSRNARQQLVARVPQRYFTELPALRSANIAAPDGQTVELAARNGRLVSAGRSLDAGATLIPVTFEFDAHPSLVPGSSVEAFLLGAEREGVLTVPAGALTESQGLYFVYEQIDSEGYLKHEVVPGASDGVRVEILSGIDPGMRIVSRGAVHVKMATASAIPHSHEH